MQNAECGDGDERVFAKGPSRQASAREYGVWLRPVSQSLGSVERGDATGMKRRREERKFAAGDEGKLEGVMSRAPGGDLRMRG
jgi:hypothetical protein